MARQVNRLSARTVVTLAKPGRHADGGGLYLVVDKAGAKRWAFLYRRDGRLREMGLGSVLAVPLARARELAAEARAQLHAGTDPIAAKREKAPSIPTFGAMADELIESMRPQFRNAKHLAQWQMTLREYAAPLRPKPVNEISTDDVLDVLRPIWSSKSETASRLRGRIERVLDAAKARGFRSGENPALWRGHLATLLPRRSKLTRGHHAAMPYADVPAFMKRLAGRSSNSTAALRFTILTAARSGEAFGATWQEFDLEKAVWTVPAQRMKGEREHRVPLSQPVLDLLAEMGKAGKPADGYVFFGRSVRLPLSNMAMDMALRRLKVDVTVHGFRSSFRDWCGEASDFPRELAEAALAHVVGDETERAYRRGDALEKRRRLTDAWAKFCVPAQVEAPTNEAAEG